MSDKFSQEDLNKLSERVERIAPAFEEGHIDRLLAMGRRSEYYIQFGFSCENEPKVDGTARYMAENYMTASGVPSLVRCDTVEEANDFLTLVAIQGDAPIDYEKVLGAASAVHEQGWRDAIYSYVEDADELPAEQSGAPYWYAEQLGDLKDAYFVTTAGESSSMGSHGAIPMPKDYPNALLVAILAEPSGEAHVELDYVFESFEIDPDSLEGFLLLQLLCHSKGRTAFVLYSLMGGIWLTTEPENGEFLEEAINSEGFQEYYDEEQWDVEKREWYSERERAVKEWRAAAGHPTECAGCGDFVPEVALKLGLCEYCAR